MEEIYNSIANLGFPIAITFYLLFRVESKLDKLSVCINDLAINISKINK
ncbi:MAG: YvrJ family protein [Paraclostridium sp.]